ncbi:MAG: hypothetical protein Edafosvirus18_3 [Edafosvirus sp.]|uniref:Uncharacterized protein n=1 Tax=Edafosvirus sp. TaxID=2487765 RepID=A0A3G4ZW23_9VIRU|nr:MAG: hypothetical protein Edafosvirus18_3 [Edafosvirus sp.]
MPKDKKNVAHLCMIYGGLMKHSHTRVFQTDKDPAEFMMEYTSHYGDGIKGRFVKTSEPEDHFNALTKKMKGTLVPESDHVYACKANTLTKMMKEIAGASTAHKWKANKGGKDDSEDEEDEEDNDKGKKKDAKADKASNKKGKAKDEDEDEDEDKEETKGKGKNTKKASGKKGGDKSGSDNDNESGSDDEDKKKKGKGKDDDDKKAKGGKTANKSK